MNTRNGFNRGMTGYTKNENPEEFFVEEGTTEGFRKGMVGDEHRVGTDG